jgi:hypothetical protein
VIRDQARVRRVEAAFGGIEAASSRRVLGRGTEFKDFGALSKAVGEVCEGQRGKDNLLTGGQADARPPDANSFRQIHETAIVGVMAQ